MTRSYLVPFVVVGVSLLLCNCVLTEDCHSKGGSNGNCSTTTAQENETKTSSSPDQEVITGTLKPKTPPKSMSMLAEDLDVFRPTPLPSIATNASSTDEPKGRALNFTMEEQSVGNVLSQNATHDEFGDLSDVSISNEDEDEHPVTSAKILAAKVLPLNKTNGICEKGGLTYEHGEKLENGCDSICTCLNGKMDCTDRCSGPYFRKGKKIDDPLCSAREADDPCCSLLICASDTETEPLEICSVGNKTYNRGDLFKKECSEVCTCEVAGKVSCKPRCPPTNKTSDRCVEVPDPNDSCCKKVLCDVTLDDHEPERDEEKPKHKLISARFINVTTILLKFDSKFDDNDSLPIIDITDDKKNWKSYQMLPGGYLFVKTNAKYLRLDNSDDIIDVQNTELGPKQTDKVKEDIKDAKGCSYKGKYFKMGEEYNDDCTSLCVCKTEGMKCLKLECPTYFGTDVLDPLCVEWETVPPDFKPVAPHCCADELRCKNNGSCVYDGQMFRNWEQLPINITGCEKRCYCEMGKVECQNTCPPVTALPPPNLNCPPQHAIISHIPEDDCCKYWVCNAPSNMPEHSPNGTMIDNEPMTQNSTDESYLGPFRDKSPSNVLGPLLVYSNDENGRKPLPSEENPFYSKNHFTSPDKSSVTPDINKHTDVDKTPQKPIPSSIFVTPPSVSQKNRHENVPFRIPPMKNQFEINEKSTPEEILHFIHQHPEISNYPSGSVVEIHNILPSHKQKPALPPYADQNAILSHNNPQQIPILVQQNSVGPHINDLPPGVTLEHILQEIHKNVNPQHQNPILTYQGHPGTGPLLIAQQSGPVIPTRQNATFSGMGGFPNYPGINGFPVQQDDVTVNTLEAIDAHTIRLAFMVPPVIVGLHGRVEVRYTHRNDEDLNSWELQVFAPPNDLIATPQLEFDLLGLKADTEYKIKITITLRDLHNTPSSRIYKIRTLKEIQTTTLPPMIPIEPDLAITDINATWVTVVWRKFTEYELQFIDGVQLRFKEIDGKIYAATPLIHRAVTSYTLENLKSNTKYEIGIFFIPFPGQLTELHAENMLHFTTANEIDTYGFNVTLDISLIKSQSVEITWNGVPYPEDKYVNIYRAIYQSDSGKEDHSTFKIAKRDSPTKTIIMDLKPGTRYRLWLEVYLTNGKIKTSNVQDFITKPRAAPSLGSSTHQDKLSRSEQLENKGDYYGPLVIVAILAAIAILSTLVLLLILVRRHNQNKAAITPPSTRISQSAYDNPTYKVEIQQETMGL